MTGNRFYRGAQAGQATAFANGEGVIDFQRRLGVSRSVLANRLAKLVAEEIRDRLTTLLDRIPDDQSAAVVRALQTLAVVITVFAVSRVSFTTFFL